MKYFTNNKNVNFKDLENNNGFVETLENRKISVKDLINLLKIENYEAIKSIFEPKDKNDPNIMEPLVYAVRKENKTFKLYRCLGDNLQKDIEFARDIIIEEPEVLKDTEAGNDENFILQMAELQPEVILNMSPSLKSNTELIKKLCDLENTKVTVYAAKECKMPKTIIANPELSNNKAFMMGTVLNDASLLVFATAALKNDYEFIREICKENKEVTNYMAEHTDEFGEVGLNAAKEVIVEDTTTNAIDEFKEELKKLEEDKEKFKSTELTEEERIKKDKELAIRERQLKNNLKFIEKIKNGEVKPERALRLINTICENLGEEYRAELMKYIKMDDAIIERQKENEKDANKGRTPEDVEKIVEKEASLKGIEDETKITKELIISERNEKLTKEVGEDDAKSIN